MPRRFDELDRTQYSDSFNRLLNVVIDEVEGPYAYGPDKMWSERSLSDDPLLEYYPVAFFGYERRSTPLDPPSDQVQAERRYVIAHINIGSVPNGEGRSYRHLLTEDGGVFRHVVRQDGPQLPVEQPRWLDDHAINGLVKHLAT
jgi:hypothetical protein